MNEVHVHPLAGCTPTPLGHYLKALGVLRLIAEQADSAARGWWKEERFWLATRLNEDEIIRFFLNDYRPSPIVAPWNLGCGLYYDADAGVAPIESSSVPRLALLKEAITVARELSRQFAAAIKATKEAAEHAKRKNLSEAARREAKKNVDACKKEQARLKERLIIDARAMVRGGALQWLDAALTVGGDGEPQYPALLGTGGNDGRLDFTNNYYQHLQRLFDTESGISKPGVEQALRTALTGEASASLTRAAIGQFLPGTAGGANMGTGYDGTANVNSWDFVLLLEGALLLASGMARRGDAAEAPQAAAPFAVRSRSVGYASATAPDESARGEQWFPLWRNPASCREITALLREGRTRLARHAVAQPVDFARAIARLGVARGIDAFERFGYIERNGQSNLATPLGRWRVRAAPHQELLDEIDGWLSSVRRKARGDTAPAELRAAARACDEAVLDVCRSGSVAQRWQHLLAVLGEAERVFVASPKYAAAARLRPIPVLSPGWFDAADDGSVEVRLAAALASQQALTGPIRELPIRMHWSPLAAGARVFEARNDSLVVGPDLVGRGLDLERDCLALLQRRVVMAGRRPPGARYPEGQLPLRAPASTCASLADIMRFLDGKTLDRKVPALARAFMAVDWQRCSRSIRAGAAGGSRVDADYAIFRLAHAADPVLRSGEPVRINLDPEISRKLLAGDLHGAASIAIRRLRASGLRPVVRVLAGDAQRARRLAASLVFPLAAADLARCADRVTKPYEAAEASVDSMEEAS